LQGGNIEKRIEKVSIFMQAGQMAPPDGAQGGSL